MLVPLVFPVVHGAPVFLLLTVKTTLSSLACFLFSFGKYFIAFWKYPGSGSKVASAADKSRKETSLSLSVTGHMTSRGGRSLRYSQGERTPESLKPLD